MRKTSPSYLTTTDADRLPFLPSYRPAEFPHRYTFPSLTVEELTQLLAALKTIAHKPHEGSTASSRQTASRYLSTLYTALRLSTLAMPSSTTTLLFNSIYQFVHDLLQTRYQPLFCETSEPRYPRATWCWQRLPSRHTELDKLIRNVSRSFNIELGSRKYAPSSKNRDAITWFVEFRAPSLHAALNPAPAPTPLPPLPLDPQKEKALQALALSRLEQEASQLRTKIEELEQQHAAVQAKINTLKAQP